MMLKCMTILAMLAVCACGLTAQGFEKSQALGSEYFKHDAPVTGVAVSVDGKYLVSGEDKNLVFWERATAAKITTMTPLKYAVASLAYSPNGRQMGIEDRC